MALGEPWAPEATFRTRAARLQSIAVDFVRRRTDVGPIAVEDFRALIARDEHGVHVPLVGSGGAGGGQGWRTTLAKVTLGSCATDRFRSENRETPKRADGSRFAAECHPWRRLLGEPRL